ncbi:MAG: alpha-L-rhamnosidase C-terminal domain-containing protein [Bacteroidota bacterium]
MLCPTLSAIGRDDLAFMLLNRKAFPSWLYPVTQGATTIWERWDTQKPDGSIIKGMNSFNHYAYGAIGDWLYSHVAGLRVDAENPAYRHTIFSPHVGGGLTNASAKFRSLYGALESSWKLVDNRFQYAVEIAPNTTGTVILPQAEIENIRMNRQLLVDTKAGGLQQNGEDVTLKLGSGRYVFDYPFSLNQ